MIIKLVQGTTYIRTRREHGSINSTSALDKRLPGTSLGKPSFQLRQPLVYASNIGYCCRSWKALVHTLPPTRKNSVTVEAISSAPYIVRIGGAMLPNAGELIRLLTVSGILTAG